MRLARAHVDLVDDRHVLVPERGNGRLLSALETDELRLHLFVLSGYVDDFQIDLAVVAHSRGLENAFVDLPYVLGKDLVPCAVLEDMRVKMLGRIAKFENVPFGKTVLRGDSIPDSPSGTNKVLYSFYQRRSKY